MAGLTVGSLVQVREAPLTTMFAPFVIPVRFVIVMLATICVDVVMARASKAEGRRQKAETRSARSADVPVRSRVAVSARCGRGRPLSGKVVSAFFILPSAFLKRFS